MNVRSSLELLAGGVLIVFGLLFLAYLPRDFQDVSTDAIFIVFGLLFARKGVTDRKESEKEEEKQQASRARKSGKQRSDLQKKSKNQASNK